MMSSDMIEVFKKLFIMVLCTACTHQF